MSSPLGGLPKTPLLDKMGNFLLTWMTWVSTAQSILQATSSSGPTASRPSSGLYVGQFWFDTSLGVPVWVKTVSPAIVWVNGAGTPV